MSSNSFVKLCSPTSGLNQLPPYSQLSIFPDWDRERLPSNNHAIITIRPQLGEPRSHVAPSEANELARNKTDDTNAESCQNRQ